MTVCADRFDAFVPSGVTRGIYLSALPEGNVSTDATKEALTGSTLAFLTDNLPSKAVLHGTWDGDDAWVCGIDRISGEDLLRATEHLRWFLRGRASVSHFHATIDPDGTRHFWLNKPLSWEEPS